MNPKKRVAILISGRGSNMSALINAADNPDYPAQIVGIISNRADAKGLKIARQFNLPVAVHGQNSATSRKQSDLEITETIENWNTDIICLAGFMRILGEEFVTHWSGRLINIHPSLLPKFPGLNTHQRALDAHEKLHGCSVHFVVPEVDTGPVFAQKSVPVMPDDSAETLAARVLEAEHRTYPDALKQLASGNLHLLNGEVVVG